MTRIALGVFALLGFTLNVAPALAQEAKPAAEPPTEAEADATVKADITPDIDLDDPLLEGDATATTGENPLADPSAPKTAAKPGESPESIAAAATAARYRDIVVVPRKDFLKTGRLELSPFSGITINDPLIRHYAFGGELTYFLTDVFGIGVQGMYMLKEQTDREGLNGLQYNRTASINRFHWQASFNFTYVPIYGKFALFNRHIIHWETYASAGVGMIQTEIIPRRRAQESFTTNAIAPNAGMGIRLFLTKWMTANVAIRDYVFNDKFEPTNRTENQPPDVVKENAEPQIVHNIMVYAGVGFYLPPSFSYRSPR
ncbi:MAG: outer membrane beta-barrel domain-containing protein [Deltaproteobacteria bacterium]|nr:outer membrane beta-barrel domain-containing protein [Deltaproteobacteria bacterium]